MSKMNVLIVMSPAAKRAVGTVLLVAEMVWRVTAVGLFAVVSINGEKSCTPVTFNWYGSVLH